MIAVLAPTAAECTLQKSEGYLCLRSLAICQGLGGSDFFSEALSYAVLRGCAYSLRLCHEFRCEFPSYRTYESITTHAGLVGLRPLHLSAFHAHSILLQAHGGPFASPLPLPRLYFRGHPGELDNDASQMLSALCVTVFREQVHTFIVWSRSSGTGRLQPERIVRLRRMFPVNVKTCGHGRRINAKTRKAQRLDEM